MAGLLAKLGNVNAIERPDDEPCRLWPENVAAWNAFLELQGQWRTNMAGPYGLDYEAVLAHLCERYPERADRSPIYAGVLACERAALCAWSKHREAAKAKA